MTIPKRPRERERERRERKARSSKRKESTPSSPSPHRSPSPVFPRFQSPRHFVQRPPPHTHHTVARAQAIARRAFNVRRERELDGAQRGNPTTVYK